MVQGIRHRFRQRPRLQTNEQTEKYVVLDIENHLKSMVRKTLNAGMPGPEAEPSAKSASVQAWRSAPIPSRRRSQPRRSPLRRRGTSEELERVEARVQLAEKKRDLARAELEEQEAQKHVRQKNGPRAEEKEARDDVHQNVRSGPHQQERPPANAVAAGVEKQKRS